MRDVWVRSGAAALATTLAVLAACGGEEEGMPTAADTSASSTPTSLNPPSRPTQTETGSDLLQMDPCELLTEDERGQLDLQRGERDDIGGTAAVCVWNQDGTGVVDVILWPNLGFDGLNTAGRTVTDVTIGSHPGRRLEHTNVTGFCDVDVAITESSSVTVGAVHAETGPACELAEQVAWLIEPRLPTE